MSKLPPYPERSRWQKIIYEHGRYEDLDDWRVSLDGWRVSTMLGAISLGCVVLTIIIVALCYITAEQGCGQKGDAYGLPSDYKFFANTCFAETSSGQTVNMENIRENSRGQTIYLEGGKSLLLPSITNEKP